MKTEKYYRKKRKYAKNDIPIEKQVPENCLKCKSQDTILIYHYYYKKRMSMEMMQDGLILIERESTNVINVIIILNLIVQTLIDHIIQDNSNYFKIPF
jgi:hypothetical protein